MSDMDLDLRVRRALRTCVRGLVQAGLSQLACVPLFVAAVVSIALIPVGIGLLLTPATLAAVRGLANRQRRWAWEWSQVSIAAPYRAERHTVGGAPSGRLRRCRWLLRDPATWRDLLWMLVNAPVGLVLGLLPAGLLVNGVFGVLVAPWIWAFAGSDSLYWPLSVPVGAAALLVLAIGGPQILKAHAVFSESLLAPSRTQIAARLGRLSESRSQVVDASATELRRIERDLHDGAQARLVALGMNIGLAEQLVRADPGTALTLLAEARESSGQALSELRDLVRGIHPPVLAERGLDGAVRALALAMPLPVNVDSDLADRPPAPVEAALYFAIAEALANVVKHSAATHAWVQLRHDRERLVAVVGDNGTGGADLGGGGLRGIQRRLAAFDGVIAVTSPSGGPTIITVELPCES